MDATNSREKRQQQRRRGYDLAPISYTERRYADPAMQAYSELRAQRILELFEERGLQKSPTARVLDVGCGTGVFLDQLIHSCDGTQPFGLDFSRTMLSEASQRLRPSRAALTQGSAFELPFADSSFDAIISTRFIHQYPNDLKLKIIREIQRCLKPEGIAIVEFYSFFAWLLRYPFTRGNVREHFMHAPRTRVVKRLVGGPVTSVPLRMPGSCLLGRLGSVRLVERLRRILERTRIRWAFDEYLAVFGKSHNHNEDLLEQRM
jgi:SAM-dependent methyltransferase